MNLNASGEPLDTQRSGDVASTLLSYGAQRALNVDDFGGWPAMQNLLPTLVDHPLLTSAAQILADSVVGASLESVGLIEQTALVLAESLSATRNPVIFRDSADHLLGSSIVGTVGPAMAPEVLKQAAQPRTDANPLDVLRAADALEVGVQLCIGGWGRKWDLYSCLDSYVQTPHEVYSRSVLRAVVACVEVWTEADELVPVARRAAGLESAPGALDGVRSDSPSLSTSALSDSDAGIALARIATLQALRAHDREDTLSLLDAAVRFTRPALAEDDRPDAVFVSDIAQMLELWLTAGAAPDSELLGRLVENAREMAHLHPQRSHWVGDRVAASHAAWSRLVMQVAESYERLDEPSWYNAPAVIGEILNVYRVGGSSRIFRRAEDGQAVRDIVVPSLANGFAEKAALLRHLEDHVRHLERVVSAGTASADDAEDLLVAREFWREAISRTRTSEVDSHPKGVGAGDLQTAGSDPAARREAAGRVRDAVSRRIGSDVWWSTSIVADDILERVRRSLDGCEDYEGSIGVAVDFVSQLLITFLWDRNSIGAKEVPYLYRPDAEEDDLARDLNQYIRASGQLGTVETEVRHVAGGRIDIQMAFPGFKLYIELKKDSSLKLPREKISYLAQAASYQVTDVRVGFLVVLNLHSNRRTPPPHLRDCVEVVRVLDESRRPRHVVSLLLSGARVAPSAM